MLSFACAFRTECLSSLRSEFLLDAWLSGVQAIMTPIAHAVNGNCHWNCNTAALLSKAGFTFTKRRDFSIFLIPMLLVEATCQ